MIQTLTAVLLSVVGWYSFAEAALGTKSLPPVITAVSPNYGSHMGGTLLTIEGTNFQQDGLFSAAVVLINNAPCEVIEYYTSNNKITCITPACTTTECMETEDFSGTEAVSLNVYVTTVEGILGAVDTFTYRGSYASRIFKMSHTTWGTASSFVKGKIMTSSLEDIEIKIGPNYADVSDPDDLNPEEYYRWSTSSSVYYRPPSDLEAGYYNLSLAIQNPSSDYMQGSGLAVMYEKQLPLNYNWDFTYSYNFHSSPGGKTYSVCLLPVIASVSPSAGSIAGGTVVTIQGSGFSKDEEGNFVYVAGLPCDVVSSTVSSIQCITRQGASASLLSDGGQLHRDTQTNSNPPTFNDVSNYVLTSPRSYGSQGWWVKVWDYDSYSANSYVEEDVRFSFGLRENMGFGFTYTIGSDWPSQMDYDSQYYRWDFYVADFATVLIAPVAGNYSFNMIQDDRAYMYGRRESESTETELMYHSTYDYGDYFYPGQEPSPKVYLQRGERYHVRVRFINSGWSDYLEVSMQVDPEYPPLPEVSNDGVDDDFIPNGVQPLDSVHDLPASMFRLNTLQDMQLIDLTIGFRYEIQRVRITGVSSGNFYLIVQGYTVTSALSKSDSESTIANALKTAANDISSTSRETNSFTVTKTTSTDGNTIWLDVQFNVHNTLPLTELQVFTGELTGGNLSYAVIRTQTHSVIPSGTFDLTYEDANSGSFTQLAVPFDTSAFSLQQQIQSIDDSIVCDVTRSGSSFTGYSYTVAFTSPRGDLPLLRVNVSGIHGDEVDGVQGSVSKMRAGSTTSLLFRPIPVWMTEVPLEFASSTTLSNVEVYVNANDGSSLKSVCDGSGSAGPGLEGMFKGTEDDCAFHMRASLTALVSNYSLTEIDAETTQIELFGAGFEMSDESVEPPVLTVTIADHPCNITYSDDNYITCEVSSVPWGSYKPVVHVEGFGNALNTAADDTTLNFKQSVYSVSPATGSFAGGQVMTISGRGFRPGASITFAGVDEPCELLSYKSWEVTCRVPHAPKAFTVSPTDGPTTAPTFAPSPATPSADDFYADDFYSDDFYAEGANASRRMLSASENEYDILVDGFDSAEKYTYSYEQTPRVLDLFPLFVSSAITTNVTFNMDFIPSAATSDEVTVTVGGEECSHVQFDGFSTVSCTLSRNRALINYNADGLVNVEVYFPSVGFASGDDLSRTPQMGRGFYINGVSPPSGSVMGGNRLTITGSGFMAGEPSRHQVMLHMEGMEALDDYNALLNALGFELYDPRDPQEEFECEIVTVSETEIVCDLAGHVHDVFDDLNYTITVTLNKVQSTTVTEDGRTALYAQRMADTPIIASSSTEWADASRDVHSDIYGVSLVMTQGFPMSLDEVEFRVGEHVVATLTEGETQSATEAHLSVRAMFVGDYNISALVPGLGYALSNAHLTVTTEITSVMPVVSEGSIAGGTIMVMTGLGFSPDCSLNNVTLTVDLDGKDATLITRDFLSCTEYEIVFLTPDVGSHLGASWVFLDNLDFSVPLTCVDHRGIHFHDEKSEDEEDEPTDHSGHRRLMASGPTVFHTPANLFSYTALSTPLVKVNATEGYAGDLISMSAFMYNKQNVTFCSTGEHMHDMGDMRYRRLSEAMGDDMASRNQCGNSHSAVTIGQGVCMSVERNEDSSATRAFEVCSVPSVSAQPEDYHVLVQLYPYGYALDNTSLTITRPTFKSLIRTTSSFSSSVESSVGGGLNITIEGDGFPSDTMVTVCGEMCTLPSKESLQYGSIQCTLPSRFTQDTQEDLIADGVEIDLIKAVDGGVYFSSLGSSSSYNEAVHDDDVETYFYHNSKTCYVGMTLPDGFAMMPYRMRFYPRLSYADRFSTYYFEGSTDGGTTYTTLATHTGVVHEGYNYVDVDSGFASNWYTTFRYRSGDSTTTSYCAIADLEFWGVTAATATSCDIKVMANSVSFMSTVGQVDYMSTETFTPLVHEVSPNNGTALGGVEVTIVGEFFDAVASTQADATGVTVAFSGVGCAVQSSTATSITCITGARAPEDVRESSIEVIIPGRGLALVDDSAEFLYIDRWSALTTWLNQEPPVDGDLVWIPDGQVVLLDVFTPELTLLYVEGDLYGDWERDISIDATYIYVNGGKMMIGTEDRPFEKNAVITLHGDRYKTIEVPHIGSKVLAVSAKGLPHHMQNGEHMPSRTQGQLEIHGKKRMRTWTFVAETAPKGQSWLWTHEPVDFQEGESVIITGSEIPGNGMDLPDFGLDEMVVLETTHGGHNVSFTAKLRYTHRSEIYVVEGREVPLRCEIGLLTRNVKLTGDDTSDGQLFGVHSAAFHSGIYRMENVEITKCGQAFNFGRYCTHSHMAGHMQSSYVKANSIHHSFQRAVTTHDTFNWEVRDNVAFDVTGHAYFVEDGTEKYNYITGNLGVLIRRSSALLKSDMKPAIFWQQTPLNFWVDNVAAHSVNFGMWFELVDATTPHDGEEIDCPKFQPLGEFYNNTFHSNAVFGLRIYPQWTPLKDPCDHDSEPDPQYLYNMLSYRNSGNGLFAKKHGQLHHFGGTYVENGDHDVFIIKHPYVNYDMIPRLKDALIIGTLSLNDFDSEISNLHKYGLYGPQNEFFYVANSTFVNYGASGAITSCNGCLSAENMNQGGNTHRFTGLKFVNTSLRIVWSATKKDIFWDLDGSLAGVPDSMITMDRNSLRWPDDCTVLSPESVYGPSIRCGGADSDVRVRRMQVEMVTPSQLYNTDLYVRGYNGGGDEFYYLPLDTSGWVFPVVTGRNKSFSYQWSDAGTSAYTMKMTLGRDEYLEETKGSEKYDDTVIFNYTPYRYDYNPYTFKVEYEHTKRMASKNSTLSLLRMGQAQYKNKTLSVVFSTEGSTTDTESQFGVYIEGQLCPPEGCPVPPVPTLDDPMLWSDPDSWPSGKVPTTGQRVTIESNMWIVMDISPPKLGGLTINGKLSFMSNETFPRDLELQTPYIALFGSMHIKGNASSDSDGTDVFKGRAQVTMFGTQGSSWPLTMTEGVYLGSKVLGVAGDLVAKGEYRSDSWTRLRTTAHASTRTIDLDRVVNWDVGDDIAVSATGYFSQSGDDLMSEDSSEVHTIFNITTMSDGTNEWSRIITEDHLDHSHFCGSSHGETFCGAVGRLSQTVRFVSLDQDDPTQSSFGFGANIHVFDIPDSARYGSINVENVEFKGFGKINTDHYAIAMKYRDYNHPPSNVVNCSFNQGYNFAVRVAGASNFTFDNNVATGNYGGGVFIDEDNILYAVTRNLVSGSYMLPSNLLSSYPWTNPIGAFVIYSPDGVVTDNLAAGSQDQGFSVATAMFHVSASLASEVCSVTMTEAYSYTLADLTATSNFRNNEAVACRGGLLILAMSPSESASQDCAVVTDFKAWRSGHTGVLSLDSKANILLANILLAENHIGVNLHFFKDDVNVFTGIVASKIIGTLGTDLFSTCHDLSDSVWDRGSQCQVFSESDPFGLSSKCNSVIKSVYRRVGVLIPQWTNKARTCAIAGRFECPTTPAYPDRLCSQPWDSRYGLPPSIAYAEQHFHDVSFHGFFNRDDVDSVNCIPSNTVEKSVAIAINPDQVDHQPTMIMSGLSFSDVDDSARFGFDIPANIKNKDCKYRPCSGHELVMIHDLDGTFANENGESGQLFFNNPQYVAPAPLCRTASSLHQDLYFCSNTQSPGDEPFKQYWGMWRDWGPQVIHPIIIDRQFEGENFNRSFASYGPVDEMCAIRMYFSRFNLAIANGTHHYIRSTGTLPDEFLIRWEAPSENHVATLEFFVQHSQGINVMVSNHPTRGFVRVPKFTDRMPTMFDPAGSNTRDPQGRSLTVTVRGGTNHYYRFMKTPMAAVTMKMDMTMDSFFSDTFIANIALLLGIDASRIKIVSVKEGSVIVDFELEPLTQVASNITEYITQIQELEELTANFSAAVTSGAVEAVIGAPLQELYVDVPVIPVAFDELADYDNITVNDTSTIREVSIAQNTAVQNILMTYPTSQPSSQPSGRPSTQPTVVPTSHPTGQPTSRPTAMPTQPTSTPTEVPTSVPTSAPTSIPSSAPTSAPTSTPTSAPTSIPTSEPTSKPTCVPSSAPTSKPTRVPTSAPTSIPSSVPTSIPTRVPSSAPTALPTSVPTSTPTSVPTSAPTSVPSVIPTSMPSSVPSSTPTSAPTSIPTSAPTSVPTSVPTTAPTSVPTTTPTSVPSSTPTSTPTSVPTSVPSSVPTSVPSSAPSSVPSSVPTSLPTSVPSSAPTSVPTPGPTSSPTSEPTSHPTIVPTAVPTSAPTSIPSSTPTSVPTVIPTARPSARPTITPTSSPTVSPTSRPSTEPTCAPTAKPTSSPTGSVEVTMEFEVTSTISNSSCSLIDPSAERAFEESIKDNTIVPCPACWSSVQVTSCEAPVSARRRLADNGAIVLGYRVNIVYFAYLNLQDSDVFDDYVSSLSTALDLGVISAALKASGSAAFTDSNTDSSSLLPGSYTITSFDRAATFAPTKSPSHDAGGDNSGFFSLRGNNLYYFLAVCLVIFALCAAIGYHLFTKKNKVVPSENENPVRLKPDAIDSTAAMVIGMDNLYSYKVDNALAIGHDNPSSKVRKDGRYLTDEEMDRQMNLKQREDYQRIIDPVMKQTAPQRPLRESSVPKPQWKPMAPLSVGANASGSWTTGDPSLPSPNGVRRPVSLSPLVNNSTSQALLRVDSVDHIGAPSNDGIAMPGAGSGSGSMRTPSIGGTSSPGSGLPFSSAAPISLRDPKRWAAEN